jgi:hypothetical protein
MCGTDLTRETMEAQLIRSFVVDRVWEDYETPTIIKERRLCARSLILVYQILSRQCGILNISHPYRLPRPVTGIALLYGDGVYFL